MTRRRAGDLTDGPLGRITLGFGAPLALAMFGHGLFNLVDMVIVGRLGPGSVASVTVAGVVLPLALVLFDGVNNVTAALVAQAHGARKEEAANEVAWESLWITAVAGVVGGALFLLAAGPLVRFFQLGDPVAVANGVSYLEVMGGGLIGMFLILQTTSILRGVGNSVWPLVILVGANILNVILDVLLVFGYLGFPRLGVVGAAWATVIAQGTGALLGLAVLWWGVNGISLRRQRWQRPFRYQRTLALVGLPTSLQLATRVLAVFFLLRVGREAVLGPGHHFLDGVGICVRLEMLAVFVGLGWASAATPVVGQNLGAGRVRRAVRGTWFLVTWAALSMALVGAGVWVFRGDVFPLVMPGIASEALNYGAVYLQISVPFYPVLALSLVVSRALNGAGSTKTAMLVDMVLYLAVMLPLATLLSGTGFAGWRAPDPAGAWWAAVATHALAALVYALVFRHGHWRRKRRLRMATPRASPAP